MQLDHLQNKKVLVVGLGESGLAMARFCALAGATVQVCDTRQEPPGLQELRDWHPEAVFTVGLDPSLLEGIDCLAWSPGLALREPSNASFLEAALQLNLKPTGEAQLFADALTALQARYGYRPKVLAITGTNGKTTTTMLTAHLCKTAGLDVVAAGNVSPSMLTVLQSRLSQDHLPQVWVLELSSFQLVTLEKLECDAATVLNLTQDHLDWHADMAEYRAAKHKIYAGANVMISNREDAQTTPQIVVPVVKKAFGKSKLEALKVVATSVEVAPPEAFVSSSFGSKEEAQSALQPDPQIQPHAEATEQVTTDQAEVSNSDAIEVLTNVTEPIEEKPAETDTPVPIQLQPIPKPLPSAITFGLSEPQSFGDFGVMQLTGLHWLAEAVASEDEMPGRKRQVAVKSWRANKLMPTELLPLVGGHNLMNAMAALALCRAIGVSYSKLLRGLSTYKGEAHRCEPVRTLDEVLYIDDSKGTNVGATVAALKGLGRKIVLIAGGDGKGQSFAALADAVHQYARAVVLIGRDAEQIAEEISTHPAIANDGFSYQRADSLEAAVALAQQLAKAGDAVLLSPACASFDMFKNYKHRAEVFIQAVSQLETKAVVESSSNLFQLVETDQ
jgi:UDP-N-acetylmuramoylalanine--D-glutamate ligase